jgi:hypothetical protein
MSVPAQQYFSYTGVTRVVKFRIRDGKASEFYKYAANISKALEAEKSAGLITGFAMHHTVDFVGVDKYDVSLVITYKDMATFDTLSKKVDPILAKAYGTPENRAANSKMGDDSCEVVSSELLRDIVVKPQ